VPGLDRVRDNDSDVFVTDVTLIGSGDIRGKLVTKDVGATVGRIVGLLVGGTVGANVGRYEGTFVGSLVGIIDGTEVAAMEGV